LSRNEIGDEGAKQFADALQKNETLTQLHLYKNRIRDNGVEHLANALGKNKTLTELHLGWNLIRDEGAKHLADALENNMTLTKLDIGGNQIGEKGAHHLASALKDNTHLTKLDLSGNEIGDAGANNLADNLTDEKRRSRETIYDVETDLGVSSKDSKTQLEALYLGWNQIGNKGILHFADVLYKNKEHITFYHSGNKIGEAAEEKLANALRNHP
jgi:Ran GTPase-activating protein (RanGAP) involved in mRNA processing and transport